MSTVSYQLLSNLAFDKGNANALFQLALKFMKGIEIKQNIEIAQLLLLMAARKEHRRAMWLIAFNYQMGAWGFPRDPDKSVYWYRLLIKKWHEDADNGDTDALGVLDVIHQYQASKHYNTTEGDCWHNE